jgi:hypothetical protein
LFSVSALYYLLADSSFSKWFVEYLIYKHLEMSHFQGTYQIIYHQYAMIYSLFAEIITPIETLLFIMMMNCRTL